MKELNLEDMTPTQELAMQYIGKYKKGVQFVEDLSMESGLLNNMPILWSDILFVDNKQIVSKTIEIWQKHFSYEYESLISIFPDYLKDVFLIKYNETYSLVYEIGNKKVSHYYEGRNPLAKRVNASVEPLWGNLPEGLRRFYNTMHDGWCYLASDTMGLVPAKDFLVLDDQDWGVLDDIEVDVDLKKVVGVFSNGAGGYVCLDTTKEPAKGLLWWHDEEPDLTIDFWPTVDEWTVIGIQEDMETNE